ncbi:MAG: peptide deformylase [bacterium]
MSLLKIRVYGDPVLRLQADEVTTFGKPLEDLARDMVETMIREDGIGLAAPQVGILERFLVIGIPGEKEDDPRRIFVFANPETVEESDEKVVMEEGCLSLPGINEEVERPVRVVVQYQDLDGNELTLEADGLLARVVQHEIDHLDGVLIVDHIPALKRSMLRARLKELEKESSEMANSKRA